MWISVFCFVSYWLCVCICLLVLTMYPEDENKKELRHHGNKEENRERETTAIEKNKKNVDGLFSGVNGKRNIAMAAVMGTVAVVAVVASYRTFANKAMNEGEDAAYIPSRSGKRVHFADEEQEDPEKEYMRQRMAAREDHLRDIRERMQQIQINQTALTHNASESEATETSVRQYMGGETKTGYDEDQASFEEEQNISTSFMTKDDLDKKRSGVAQLQHELQLQRQHLVHQRGQMNTGLGQSLQAYRQRYPGDEHPMIVMAMSWLTPPTTNQQQQQ